MTKALNVDTIFNLETVLLGYDHWFLAKFHDHYVPTNNIPFTYEKSKNIQIYPNPATNQITLTYKQMDISSICIYNMQGILVYESKIPIINTQPLNIQFLNLTNGIYYLKAIGQTGIECVPFVVQK